MSLLELLVLSSVAGVCGALGQSIAGILGSALFVSLISFLRRGGEGS